jgi:hypothetical protein
MKSSMKGTTMVYDIIVLVGAILLIAIIVFWSVNYGAALVSDAMLQSPTIIQAGLASDMAIACGWPGNISVDWDMPQPYTMTVRYNATQVQAVPSKSKYYYSDVERGGYIGFGIKPALPWVSCGLDVVPRGVPFDETKHRTIVLSKQADDLRIMVR